MVARLTLLSRILGYVRDAVTVQSLGRGLVSDSLVFAWTVPNAFRRLFGEGALSAAFLPTFTRVLDQKGPERAREVANNVISWLALLLLVLAGGLVALLTLVDAPALAARLDMDLPRVELTLAYVRLLLPYLAIICVIAQFMAVLNAVGEFAVPAFAPVLLNGLWIAGALVARRTWPDDLAVQGYVIVGSILLAAVVQFAWHLPHMRARGVGFRPVRPHRSPELREVAGSMAPLLLAMGAAQVNIIADRTIAMVWLDAGGATEIYLGLRIVQFPLGLVSIAISTAVFPVLSRLLARHDHGNAAAAAGRALRANLLLTLPAAAGLLLLAPLLLNLLFVGGRFEATDAQLATQALLGYAGGLPFFGTVMLLNRACFAMGDPGLPMRVALATVVVNLALDVALVGPFGVIGLAAATSLTALIQGTALFLLWRARLDVPPGTALLGWHVLPTVAATVVMTACVAVADGLLEGWLPAHRAALALRVLLDVIVGFGSFALVARCWCREEWTALSVLWRRGSGEEPEA